MTGVGGPTPRSIARTLKQFGGYKKYELIGIDINKYAVGLYQNDLFDHTFLVPPAYHENYWTEIERLIEQYQIEIAIVQPELEILEWSKRAKNGKLPCKVLMPQYNIVKALIDKGTMTEFLEPYDLVPKSVRLNHDNLAISEIDRKIGFPFWIRSTSGSSGLGSLKVENEVSLKNWLTINPKVDEFLASEYLPGRNLACKLLYFEGEIIRAAVGERVHYIMAKVAPSGITGNTSFGRLLNDEKVFGIAKKALEMIFEENGMEPHGFFTVDLKEDTNGMPKVTEINVRMVAFNDCFAAGGANFSQDIVRLLDGDTAFDRTFKMYQFEQDLIFLRDVDSLPIVMKETDLLQ